MNGAFFMKMKKQIFIELRYKFLILRGGSRPDRYIPAF